MKKLIFTLTVLVTLTTLMTSCNSYKRHVTNAYYQKADATTKLAIVPVRFTLNGPIVNRFTEEKLIQVEEMESYRFQNELTAHVVRKMGKRRRKVSVNLQDINTTNKLLKENGYAALDVYDVLPEELGKVLGVDAVMLVDIESNQLFTNFESEAIKTGVYILEGILGSNPSINYGGIPTGNAWANATIVDTKTSALLWANRTDRTTRVKHSSGDALANINQVFGRTFPFRNRDF